MKKNIAKIGIMALILSLFLIGCNDPKNENNGNANNNNKNNVVDEKKTSEKLEEIKSAPESDFSDLTLLNEKDIDFDNDSKDESIKLYTSALKNEDGEVEYDDRQKWTLVATKDDKEYILFDDYIQLGKLDFFLYASDDSKFKIVTVQHATANLTMSEYTYNEKSFNFEKKNIYNAQGINMYYNTSEF